MEYILDRPLGEGSYGQVYLGYDRDGNKVAIKIATYELNGLNGLKLRRETDIPVILGSHSNLAVLRGIEVIGDKVYIISDYIDGSLDLGNWVRPDTSTSDGQRIILHLLYDLSRTYAYIHSCQVAHRDIKLDNILMQHNRPIIIDWDLACSSDPKRDLSCLSFVGTPRYLPPEVWLRQSNYNPFQADVYSLGIVFYYLVVGAFPHNVKTQKKLKEVVTSTDSTIVISSFRDEVNDLIFRMMRYRPDNRPSMDDVATKFLNLLP